MEFSETSLFEVMLSRKKAGGSQIATTRVGYLSEHEVWAVFTQVITALNFLYENHLFYGDIQPAYIHIFDQKSMKLKLFDPKYCSTEKTGYRRKCTNLNYQTPLCPIGLQDLYVRSSMPSFSPEKSEVFGLGITLLSMMMCEDYIFYYDTMTYKVDFETIGSKLGKLKASGYSDELTSILADMLSSEEGERPNIARLTQLVMKCNKNSWGKQNPSGIGSSATTVDYSRNSHDPSNATSWSKVGYYYIERKSRRDKR